jgi:hypothetical protein
MLFLWAKGLNTKVIRKEMFHFMVGSVCRLKPGTTGGKRYADDEEVETEGQK